MLKVFTLKNGLKVAAYSITEMRSIFLSISSKGGSIVDPKDKTGTAHFMEHLLVQGIPSLPTVEAFSDFIEGLAGSYGASTYPQTVRFSLNVPAAFLKDALRLAGEVFYEPLFSSEAIERERGAILAEIRQKQDSIWYKNYHFFAKNRFKKEHPLLLDSAGTEQTIAKICREDLLKFWGKYFYPSNSYLVLVGGFNVDQIEDLIVEALGKYNSSKKFSGFPKLSNEDFTSKNLAIREDQSLRACYVDLSFPSVWGDAPLSQRIKRPLTKNILANLRGSRLFRLLRQRKGLVYDIGSSSTSYRNFGYADIYSQAAVENLDEVIELITKELLDFVKNGPTKEEVNFAKNHFTNRILMQWDHPSAIADWIAGDLLWEDKIYTPEEYVKLIDKVDTKTINHFIKKYWDFSKLVLTIQGPIKNNSENLAKFKKIISPLDS